MQKDLQAEIEEFKEKIKTRFAHLYAKNLEDGTRAEIYNALASLVRDIISEKWLLSDRIYHEKNPKKIYYFSIEFMPGRFLLLHLINLGKLDTVAQALQELNINLAELADYEQDPGLGNGGLGRLAAAFIDSLAALGLAACGMGIRYRYGFFEQKFVEAGQVELPDNWLLNGCAWEYRRPEAAETIKFGGQVRIENRDGRFVFIQENYEAVRAVPYDLPVTGYRNDTINRLRLWSAETDELDFEYHTFSRGEYAQAFARKIQAESISQVLYPDDTTYEGKRLRLKQQYFLVSAGLQNIIRMYKKAGGAISALPEQIAVHINDTHPALAIPELVRILVDEEGLGWDEAWDITQKTVSYTNHTILPEALEKWPVHLFQELLPRVYMIVEEINNRFCRDLMEQFPGQPEKIRPMAIIGDGFVKMANLAVIGSHSVNGVARLHTEILKSRVMHNFNELYPGKFNNKTNGITHRRWILLANPRLGELITDTIGPQWINQPMELKRLAAWAKDQVFREKIDAIKLGNKLRLASFIRKKYDVLVDPASIFDIHIKRIHGYKRQLLNILHILHLYNLVREMPHTDLYPRTFIFGGKAAPAYYLAKRVIRLINTVAHKINSDESINGRIKVVFLENYNVSLAELAFPAADVSEQIATASKEASGTGNMKFMMNGAITLGTLDGANIEIREQVGAENFIEFGISAEEVLNYYQFGGYMSWDVYKQDPRVQRVCEQMVNGFLPEHSEFQGLYDHLLHYNDEFFVLRDFASYAEAHRKMEELYKDRKRWTTACINNIAASGIFSCDRTVREYARDIWGIDLMNYQN